MARVQLVFDGSSRGAVAAARQTREGLAGVSREGKAAAGSLREVERDAGRASRGVLAGSGLFRSFGRSVAFASASFLGAAGFIQVVRRGIELADNLDRELERSDAIFGSHAKQVDAWSKTTAAGFGVAQVESLKYANTLGELFKRVGVAPTAIGPMSEALVRLAGDIARVRGVDPSDVIEAMVQGIRGRTRALGQFGVVIDQAALKEEAYRLGLVKSKVDSEAVALAQDKIRIAQAKAAKALSDYGANSTQAHEAADRLTTAERAYQKALAGSTATLTPTQKALAFYNLALQQTTDVQKKARDEAGSLHAQMKKLKAEGVDALTNAGQVLTPVLTTVVTKIADWLSKSQNQEKVTNAVKDAVAKLTEIVKAAWPEIQKIAGAADAAAKAVGGWKNAILLLAGVEVLKKVAGLEVALARVGKTWKINLALIGAAAIGLALIELQKKLDALTGATQGGRTGRVAVGTGGRVTVDPLTGQLYGGDKGAQLQIPETVAAKELGVSLVRLHAMVANALKQSAATVDQAAAAITTPAIPTTIGGRAGSSKLGTTLAKQPGAPIQSAIVTTARTQLGIPYQYGGPAVLFASTDCSGLVKAVLDKSGITGVPRTAEEQYQQAPIKDPAVLLPGDLVFYDSPHIGHVGIYIGDGQMIVDPHTGDHVKYESITGPGPVVATARWWDTAAAIHGTPTAPAAPAAATDTHAGADTTGGALTVAHPPKKGRKTAAPSIQQQLDALFGIKETLAQRTKRLSDDATVIAAELRWVDEQLAGKPNAADRLDLERLKTDLLAKAKDIVKQEQEKQKKLAAEFAAQQKAPGPTQPELEHAATRPGRASELGAVGVEASRAVIDKRLALDAAARKAAHEKELADEQARWKRLQDAGARGVKRYNDAIRAAAQAGLEMLRGVDLSKRLLAGLKELPKDAEVTIGTDLFGRPIQMSLTKVRARIAELVNIIQTGSKQAREKALAEFGQIASGIGQAMTAAAQAAQQHVDALRTAFETAFGRVSDSILTGFDRQTQATVTGMQAGVSAQIDAINRQTQAEIDQLNEQVSEKISSLQKATQAKVKQLQEAGQAATPAEAQITSLQAQHDAAQAAQALADAQRQLQQATTPEERAAAQKQIDELLYQQRIAALQKVAQAERAARDKQTQDQVDALQEQEQKQEKALQKELSGRVQALQDEAAAQATALQTQLAAQIQNYEDMRAAQRQWLTDQLLAWQTNIENGTATLTDFVTWLQGQGANGVLQGVDLGDPVAAMGDAGQKQGSAFADAFIDELRRAYQAYLEFQAAVSGGTPVGSSGGPPDWGGPPGSGGTPPSRQTRNGGGGRGGGGGRSFAFAMGGVVPGTYVGRQDTIAARVTPGEEVIDRRDVLRLARFLDTVDSGGGRGPAVVINKPNFFGGTPRQVNQAVARSIEPHLGRLAKYRSPL